VRITAQLINTADGYHVWSETYDRELQDIFAVRSQVAQTVAKALQVTLARDAR
jgi:adenylate cyclase